MTDAPPRTRWVTVCASAQLTPDRGVAARVEEALVAVFVLADGSAYAIDQCDPFTGAAVLSRGLIGDVDGAVFEAPTGAEVEALLVER